MLQLKKRETQFLEILLPAHQFLLNLDESNEDLNIYTRFWLWERLDEESPNRKIPANF